MPQVSICVSLFNNCLGILLHILGLSTCLMLSFCRLLVTDLDHAYFIKIIYNDGSYSKPANVFTIQSLASSTNTSSATMRVVSNPPVKLCRCCADQLVSYPCSVRYSPVLPPRYGSSLPLKHSNIFRQSNKDINVLFNKIAINCR